MSCTKEPKQDLDQDQDQTEAPFSEPILESEFKTVPEPTPVSVPVSNKRDQLFQMMTQAHVSHMKYMYEQMAISATAGKHQHLFEVIASSPDVVMVGSSKGTFNIPLDMVTACLRAEGFYFTIEHSFGASRQLCVRWDRSSDGQ